MNALGRVFMNPLDSQWDVVAQEIKRLKEITPIIVMDFHAEATAEKICFGKYCAELGMSAFLELILMCKLLMKVLLKGWHTSQMPDFAEHLMGLLGWNIQPQ